MSRIVGAVLLPYRLRLHAPHIDARGGFGERHGLLLELRTDDGRTAWGDCAPLPPYSPDLASCRAALERLLPLLTGLTPALAWQPGEQPLLEGLPGPAAAAVEAATGYLVAQEQGRALGQLVGCAEVGRPVRLKVNALVDRDDDAEALAQAAAAAAEGYTSFKVKLGPDPGRARDRLLCIRKMLGPGVELRVDANGCWTPDTFLLVAPALRDAGVSLVEQPVAPDLPAEAELLAALRRATGLRIALDESMASPGRDALIATNGALDAVVLKPSLLGLKESARLADEASRRGLDVIVTGSFESGVGFGATLETAAAIATPGIAQGLATGLAILDNLAIGVPRPHGGVIELPGAGIFPTVEAVPSERQG